MLLESTGAYRSRSLNSDSTARNPNPLWELSDPFQSGASLEHSLVIAGNVGDYCRICRPLHSVWAKVILETFTL